jgi:hypothetical protein
MLYYEKGLGKRTQVILSSIVVEQRVKHEDPSSVGRREKAMESKITFVKEKGMLESTHS